MGPDIEQLMLAERLEEICSMTAALVGRFGRMWRVGLRRWGKGH
jgi:hypothetical protein